MIPESDLTRFDFSFKGENGEYEDIGSSGNKTQDPRFKFRMDESKAVSSKMWAEFEENILLKKEIIERIGHADLNKLFLMLVEVTRLDLGTRLTFVSISKLIIEYFDVIDDANKLEMIGQLALNAYSTKPFQEFFEKKIMKENFLENVKADFLKSGKIIEFYRHVIRTGFYFMHKKNLDPKLWAKLFNLIEEPELVKNTDIQTQALLGQILLL